jgi:hypothetical protein
LLREKRSLDSTLKIEIPKEVKLIFLKIFLKNSKLYFIGPAAIFFLSQNVRISKKLK